MHYYYRTREVYTPPVDDINHDIRSLTDPNQVTPPNLGVQRLGRGIIRTGRGRSQVLTTSQIITGPNGPSAEVDPNNIVDKYQDKFDDFTFYRGT